MRKLLSLASIIVLSLSVVPGAAFAQDATIEETGPGSKNIITYETKEECRVENDFELDVDNDTDQDSDSGNAETEGNNEGGNAQSGNASNNNSTTVTVWVVNEANEDCVSEEREVEQPEEPTNGEEDEDENGGGATLGDSDVAEFENLPATGVESPVVIGLGALSVLAVLAAGFSRFGLASVLARIRG